MYPLGFPLIMINILIFFLKDVLYLLNDIYIYCLPGAKAVAMEVWSGWFFFFFLVFEYFGLFQLSNGSS